MDRRKTLRSRGVIKFSLPMLHYKLRMWQIDASKSLGIATFTLKYVYHQLGIER